MGRQDKSRYLFIDLLRFGAVVFMLQGHTFDALLKQSVKQASLFFVHDFFHGFVAPMFLFASGVAFGVATYRKWDQHLCWSATLRKRLGRFLGLILVGYALHLPFFSLSKIVHESSSQEIAAFMQVDALQCIGVTLLILQILVLVLGTRKRLALAAVGLGAGTILLSPILWSFSLRGVVPLWMASYLNAENSSWFPLFPWSSYLFLGTAFAYLFVEAKEHLQAVTLMRYVAVVGLFSMGVGIFVAQLPFELYPAHDYWKVNPSVLISRAGFLLIVTSILFFFEHLVKIPSTIPTLMGKESLAIYVLHLMIIYGSVVNKGLEHSLRGKLTVPEALLATGLLLVLMGAFAFVWNAMKQSSHRPALVLKFGLVATFLLAFLTRPY
jgi:hypothetical protein